MKKVIAITIVLTLVLAAVSNGKDSPQGGSDGKGQGFKIDVPTFDKKVKQGETRTINIKIQRGEFFKQDVELKIESAEGISIDPAEVTVKASDEPVVQLSITVAQDAALGKYRVNVTGTPEQGQSTSVEFKVKVVSADAGYFNLQSNSPKGGGNAKGEEFRIAVPAFETKIKQGDTKSVIISLKRGKSFNQDVTLNMKLVRGEGITFDPDNIIIKASDQPDVQSMITVPNDADLGDYVVSVTGTPTTGQATSVEFKVKVVSP
ncbi:MAG: hypothetical protein WC962_03755 [Phycisphaerae bacterium]|jgi:uncharacterized membrane protein